MRKACMKKSYPPTRKAPFFSASECRKAGMKEYVQVRGKGGMYYLKYTSGSARWMKRPYSKRAEEGRQYRKSKKKKKSTRKKRSRKRRSSKRKRSSRRKRRSSSKRKRRKRLTSKQRRYGRRGSVKTTAIYKRTKSGGYRLRARAAYNAGVPLGSVRLLLNGKRKCLKLKSNGSPFWGAC